MGKSIWAFRCGESVRFDSTQNILIRLDRYSCIFLWRQSYIAFIPEPWKSADSALWNPNTKQADTFLLSWSPATLLHRFVLLSKLLPCQIYSALVCTGVGVVAGVIWAVSLHTKPLDGHYPPRSSWEPWHRHDTRRVHLGSLDMGSVPPMWSMWSSPSQPSLRLTPVHSQTHTWVLKSSQKILSCQLSPVPPSAEALSCILGRQDWMYGRIGKRTKTQFCIPLHSSCLPLESSQRRQRHPIATPLKDTKGRNPTTEQFFCIFCVDFECQSEKGGDPASGPPPSLPAGEGKWYIAESFCF